MIAMDGLAVIAEVAHSADAGGVVQGGGGRERERSAEQVRGGGAGAEVAELSTLFLRPAHLADGQLDDADRYELADLSADEIFAHARRADVCGADACVFLRADCGRVGGSLGPEE